MKRSLIGWTLGVVLVVAGATEAGAQGLDIKTGSWQFVVTIAGVPTEASSLPANVRERILEEMKKPRAVPGCITPEDLRNLTIGKVDEDDRCKVTSRKTTATTADFVRTCAGDPTRTETVHIEASSKESLRADITSTGHGPAKVTMVGKWIGPTCQEDR